MIDLAVVDLLLSNTFSPAADQRGAAVDAVIKVEMACVTATTRLGQESWAHPSR